MKKKTLSRLNICLRKNGDRKLQDFSNIFNENIWKAEWKIGVLLILFLGLLEATETVKDLITGINKIFMTIRNFPYMMSIQIMNMILVITVMEIDNLLIKINIFCWKINQMYYCVYLSTFIINMFIYEF